MSKNAGTYASEAADMAALRESLATMLGALIDSATALRDEPVKVEALRDLMAEHLAELIRVSCQGAVAAHVAASQALAGVGGPPQ